MDEPVPRQPGAPDQLGMLGQVARRPQDEDELGPLPPQLPARRAVGVGGRHDDLAGAGELDLLDVGEGDRHDALARAQVDPVGGHGQARVGQVPPLLDGVGPRGPTAARVEVGLSAEEGGRQRQAHGPAGEEEAARGVVDGVAPAPHEQFGVAGGEHDLVGGEGAAHRVDDGRDGVGAPASRQGGEHPGRVPPHEVLPGPLPPDGGPGGDDLGAGHAVASPGPVSPAPARPTFSAAAEVPGTMSSARRSRSPAGSQ